MGDRYDLLIRRGTAVLPDGTRTLDIGIRGGLIASLGEKLDACPDTPVLEAEGLWILPGTIDAHVHFNEPGLGHWEGFETGSAALAAGGCTAYADMPLNGRPPTVTVQALRLKEAKAEGNSAVDYAFWGGLVPGNLEELEALWDAGVIGFKAFLSDPGGEGEGRFREVDDLTLWEGMNRIASFGGLLALHAESGVITGRLAHRALAEGKVDAAAFAASRPVIAELEAVGRALLMAERSGCSLHFVHISSPEAVDLIAGAKAKGIDVTVETCPHYLTLTETDMERLGPVAKCAPPLRDEARKEGLWQRLLEGKIDLIASDHSPCPEPMKSGSFFAAWGGISGAQNTLELLLDEGLKRGMTLNRLSEVLSLAPARRFGFYPRKGRISPGFDADLTLVKPNVFYVFQREHLFQRNKQCPYVGRTFPHRVAVTISRGRLVYSAEGGILERGGGIRIFPSR